MGGRDGEAVSPGSRVFHAPGFDYYVIAVMGVKTTIDPQVVKQGLIDTLLKHPRFSSILVKEGRKWRWKPSRVKIEEHVIVAETDPHLDIPEADQFLQDYVSNITTTPLDISKPLWEIHLLLNLKTSEESESVCVMRIHHSLGDGASLMSLLLASSRKTSDHISLPTVPVLNKATTSGDRSLWRRLMLTVWGVVTLLLNTMVDLVMFGLTVLFLTDSHTPLKGSPPPARGAEVHTMRFVHRHLGLDDVKLVKNAMNMTINDVLLGVTLAAVTRYLTRAYGDVEADGKQRAIHNDKLRKLRFRATIMVNVRPTAGIQELAEMMGEKSKGRWGWGNCLGFVLVPFPIVPQDDDPLQYVRQAKAMIDRKKHSLESYCTFYCAKLVLNFLGIKVASGIIRRVFSNTTMAFSNVVGPLEEISCFGHPLSYIAPSTYGHPHLHALTIHFQSYYNKMTLSMAVDQTAIPDPHLLCDDFQLSLQLIRNALNKNLISIHTV